MEIEIFDHTFYFLSDSRQWAKLYDFLSLYLLNNAAGKLAVLLAAAACLMMLVTIPVHGTKKRRLNDTCLALYAAALLLLFVFSREGGTRGLRIFSGEWYLTDGGFHEANILVTLLNFTLFIPYGFLLRKALGPHKKLRMLLAILAAAILPELLQLLFARGYTALQDLLAYILGALLGWLLMLPFGRRPSK